MVFLTRIVFYAFKARKAPRKYTMSGLRDSLRIYVKAGTGGNGLPKFGGVGGKGGDVVVAVKETLTLEEVYRNNKRKRYMASDGVSSSQKFVLGVPGENIRVDVPPGITIYSDDGKKLGELNEEGDEVVVAKGGSGGHPYNDFIGRQGQAYSINLDLKLIADVGLVGFPNAGKSTLLKGISHAKPKIASYPFTTIRPNIGIIAYKDFRQISIADLPGLIEGAHANKGMGHKFLKHVERTKLLLLIVDINGFQLGPQYPHRTCLDTVVLLNKELEMYNPELLNKPAVILVNKMDTEGAMDHYNLIRHKILKLTEVLHEYPEEIRPQRAIQFDDILGISARDGGDDIEIVKERLRHVLDVNAELELEQEIEDSTELIREFKQAITEKGPRLV